MQRLVIYLKRRADLPRPVFFDWWLDHHSALATQLPGLRQYIISLVADEQEGPFDGLAELWFDDLAAAEAAFTSTAGQAVRTDADTHVARRERPEPALDSRPHDRGVRAPQRARGLAARVGGRADRRVIRAAT